MIIGRGVNILCRDKQPVTAQGKMAQNGGDLAIVQISCLGC